MLDLTIEGGCNDCVRNYEEWESKMFENSRKQQKSAK